MINRTITVECELSIGEIYDITGQCPEPFKITKIDKNKIWGIYMNRQHLGICPLDVNNLHKKHINKPVEKNDLRCINHTYSIKYSKITDFEFIRVNDTVSYEEYSKILDSVERIVNELNSNIHTRRAIITLNSESFNSCLISIQFLVKDYILYVTSNFRSQHEDYGRPDDERLLRYLTTKILNGLSFKVNDINISVNVADYHC